MRRFTEHLLESPPVGTPRPVVIEGGAFTVIARKFFQVDLLSSWNSVAAFQYPFGA